MATTADIVSLQTQIDALTATLTVLTTPGDPGEPLNTGDTAWMLCSTALVLFMTMPGLALYYSGMVREKNMLACTMQVFTICCLVTFLWLVFGYSLSFGPAIVNMDAATGLPVKTTELWGDGSRLWLQGLSIGTYHFMAPTIPESVFCTYQLTFAIITCALICGSFADRMKFIPMIIFITVWHLAVYCPLAHANWHPSGLMKNIGVLDYAGGNVVHICSGASGLATVLVVGNRRGFGKERFEPHNILLTFMGMSMLWVGWFGFNAGSALGANFNAGYAMLATQIATSVAALMWLLTEWAIRKKPSVLGMISGAIAGLVCITPAAGYVDMTGAFFIGFFGGPLCYAGAQLKHMVGFDDALDAFGVHAIGGIVGGIATAFFANPKVNVFGTPSPFLFDYAKKQKLTVPYVGSTAYDGYVDPNDATIIYKYGPYSKVKGVYYGNMQEGGFQLGAQVAGILFAFFWAFTFTLVICKVIDLTIGMRVSEEDEEMGLDSSIHGETNTGKQIMKGEYDVNSSAHGGIGGASFDPMHPTVQSWGVAPNMTASAGDQLA